jgi:hypothetical protein
LGVVEEENQWWRYNATEVTDLGNKDPDLKVTYKKSIEEMNFFGEDPKTWGCI